MSANELPPRLRPNAADSLAVGLRSMTSLVDLAAPGMGSFVGELIGVVIPGQREDRAYEYMALVATKVRTLHESLRQLTDRLEASEARGSGLEAEIRQLAQQLTAEQVALLEEGGRVSVKATAKERIEQVATLVANGLSNTASVLQDRQLLQLLDQLRDDDLVAAMYFTFKYRHDGDWCGRHEDIIGDPFVPHSAGQAAKDAKILRDFRNDRLVSLNVLEIVRSTNGDERKQLAPLGWLLLRRLGLIAPGEH